MSDMKKFTFTVGITHNRTVTVTAADLDEAKNKARAELDRRAHKSGQEAPVAWDLTLVPEKKPILTGVVENEDVLPDDYPVYGDYLYVADNQVVRSDVFGTVRTLKQAIGAAEVRRCNLATRNLLVRRTS